jgi:hypothetical protein
MFFKFSLLLLVLGPKSCPHSLDIIGLILSSRYLRDLLYFMFVNLSKTVQLRQTQCFQEKLFFIKQTVTLIFDMIFRLNHSISQ